MPWWVIANTTNYKRGMMGPYGTSGKAQSIIDGFDDGYAEMFQTESYNRSEAAQEIRHQKVRDSGLEEGFKNFRHKGVGK